MQNYFAIETEAAHRRFEWQRETRLASRAAEARPANREMPWVRMSHRLLARLCTLPVDRTPCAPAWFIALARISVPGCSKGTAPV